MEENKIWFSERMVIDKKISFDKSLKRKFDIDEKTIQCLERAREIHNEDNFVKSLVENF
jgi:hypothetical protein